jgi:N-acetylglutamate synthase-like GNAT family acetyltransferase
MMRIEYLADRADFIPELARLHFQEWGYLRPEQTLEARTKSLRARCGHRCIPQVVVATIDDEVLGSAMLLTHDLDIRKDLSPWLAGVYVKSAYRKQGIATQLICRIEEEASALGVRRLYLYTPSAEAFYSRLGWQLTERCEYKGICVTVMEKTVHAQPVI